MVDTGVPSVRLEQSLCNSHIYTWDVYVSTTENDSTFFVAPVFPDAFGQKETPSYKEYTSWFLVN